MRHEVKMTISELGSIGELIGAIAVFATLLYLALQIRQNTIATRAQIHQARADQAQDYFLFTAGTREFASILNKVKYDPENLSLLDDEERIQFQHYVVATTLRFENTYYQWKQGFLSEDLYERNVRVTKMWFPIWKELGMFPSDSEYGQELHRIDSAGGA
jgi:hypothetical protein